MEEIGDSVACPVCGNIQKYEQENKQFLNPSTMIGQYMVGNVLGAGGFGVTYVGFDTKLSRKVAIKEYFPSNLSTRVPGQTHVTAFTGEKQTVFNHGKQRFIEEAQLLMRFANEEGIVSVYDVIEANGTVYMIMEYVEGITLKQRIEQFGPIPEKELVESMIPMLLSLKFVHNIGYIHRDISPDNIMCMPDSGIKLLDFGAARYSVMDESKSLSVIIKQGYTPIEQYQSHGKQGEYTDVYAVGATMYKALTGITPEESLERLSNDTLKKPSQCGIEISEQTENAVLAALNVRPEDRPQTIDDFIALLCGISKMDVVTKKKSKKPMWFAIAGGAVALCAVAGILIGVFTRPNLGAASDIVVPNVIKKTTENARETLKESSLGMSISGFRLFDEELVDQGAVDANCIVEQDPVSGSDTTADSNVKVVVSKGKKKQYVPDVSYMTEEGAKDYFDQLGFGNDFKIEIKKEKSDTHMVGTVIYQDIPQDSAVDFDGKITLTISLGSDELPSKIQTYKLPDYTGKEFDAVKDELKAKGVYLVKLSSVYSSTHPYGTIISQFPQKGAEIKTGEAVYVVYSLGQEMTRVPDVMYMTLDQAKTALAESGLSWCVKYAVVPGVETGLVAAQYFEPGIKTHFGTEIELTVSAAEAGVELVENANFKIVPESVRLDKGEEYKFELEGAEKAAFWGSSDAAVVSISQDGKAKANKFGSATVFAIIDGDVEIAQVIVDDKEIFTQINDYQITVGETISLNGSIPNAIRSEVTWRSSCPEVATVDEKGNVKALKVGSSVIFASYKDQLAQCTITVKEKIEYIKVSKSSLRGLYTSVKQVLERKSVPCTVQLEYNNSIPENYVYEIRFEGYNDTENYYFIKGTQVTLKCSKGGVPVSSVSVSPTSVTLKVGDTKKLTATVSPGDAQNKSVLWTSSDSSVATVDTSGSVKAKKAGKATITAKSGNKTATCTVTVTGEDPTLSIKSMPTKTTYYIGDTIDRSGMVLSYKDDTGKVNEIKDGFTVTCDTQTAGEKTATVTYKNLSKTFKVTVKTPTITITRQYLGDILVLGAKTEPENQTVTWSSTNTSVFYFPTGSSIPQVAGEGEAFAVATMIYNGKTYTASMLLTVETTYDFEIRAADQHKDRYFFDINTDIPNFDPRAVIWTTSSNGEHGSDRNSGIFWVYVTDDDINRGGFTVSAQYMHNGRMYTAQINVKINTYNMKIFRTNYGGSSEYSVESNIPGFVPHNVKWSLVAENSNAWGDVTDKATFFVDENGTGSYYTVYASYVYNGKIYTAEYTVTGIKVAGEVDASQVFPRQ